MTKAAVAVAAIFVSSGAQAVPGLTLTQWYDIPFYNYYPSSSTIDQEKAYTSTTTPDSTDVYLADPTGYSLSVGDYTAAEFTGSLNIAVSGFYTFSLNADDAGRLSIDGVTIAESNFYGGDLDYPDTATVELSAGAHSYDAFYFQEGGGAYFSTSISDGPADVTFDSVAPSAAVPEPATLSLLGLGALGVLAARRRKAG